jgi:hypothetical protein
MHEPKRKKSFFAHCGRNCANTGIIEVYKKLYLDSGNNLDMFFKSLCKLENIDGRVLIPEKIYEIIYPQCLCDLHTLGYVNSDYICECSRQSIIYVMSTLEPQYKFQVDKLTSILSGDKECLFRVSVDKK